MKRTLIAGGLVGLAAYVGYQWYRQKGSWPNGVPLGNLIGGGLDPTLYITIGLGALGAYAFKG